jgi:alanine racemase
LQLYQCGYFEGLNRTSGKDMFRFIDRMRYLYGDIKGLLRKGKITVKINGKACKVLGQIGMYHCIVDITNVDAKINDEVYLDVKPIYVEAHIRREYI